MQTQGGAAAEKAILSRERVMSPWMYVDWNRDGWFNHVLTDVGRFVESATTDRMLKGTAPEEILLVEGSSAAELTVTLSGTFEGKTLANVFSPYQKNSVFYGQSLAGAEIAYGLNVETEDGEVSYQQFVGFVRTITPNRAEGTVEITALDWSEMLRKAVQLPPWAVPEEQINYGEFDSQQCYSDWVIDHCLRLCNVGQGPKRPTFREEMNVPDNTPDGVLLHVSGNGSYLPTVGYCDNLHAQSFANPGNPMYAQIGPRHPNGPTPNGPRPSVLRGLGLPTAMTYNKPSEQGVLKYWAADQDLIPTNGTHYLGFTLVNSEVDQHDAVFTIGEYVVMTVYLGWAYAIRVYVGAGKVWTELFNAQLNQKVPSSSAKIDIPHDQEYIDVVINWDLSPQTGIRYSLKVGANQTAGWVNTTWTGGAQQYYDLNFDRIKGLVQILQAVSICDIFYAVRNVYNGSPHWTDDMYRKPKYAAQVDVGMNVFSHMPSSKAQSAWDIITNVASAEFGAAFWDEEGWFRFWNFNRLGVLQDTIVREYSIDDIEGLQLTESLDSVRNIYTLQTAKRRSISPARVFESQDVYQFYVPNNTIRYFRIWQDDVVSPLTWPVQIFPFVNSSGTTIEWNDGIDHGCHAQYYEDGIWKNMGGLEEDPNDNALQVTMYFSSLGYLTLRVYNAFVTPIRFAVGDGDASKPSLHIAGTKIVSDATLSVNSVNRDSLADYGPKILDLSGEWYQETYGLNTIVSQMQERTKKPIPTTDAITTAGDPRIQMADAIIIRDPEGFGDNLHFQILGINRTFERDKGLTDVLTLEAARTDGTTWADVRNAHTWGSVNTTYDSWFELLEG